MATRGSWLPVSSRRHMGNARVLDVTIGLSDFLINIFQLFQVPLLSNYFY